MYPQVGYSGDPVEGLEEQLTELIGLIKIVPRLIDADRGRRWEDIYERSGEGELYPTPLDAYEGEAGPEEGWGHADYSYTIQEAYAKVSLKKYKPMAARNEDRNVSSGLL